MVEIDLKKFLAAPLALMMAVSGCGGGDRPSTPSAEDAQIQIVEDTSAVGTLHAINRDPGVLTYRIASPPAHGHVQIEGSTGNFTYVPEADFFGQDTFTFTASSDARTSPAALVSIAVTGVNDAPRLTAIPDMTNSATSRKVSYRLDLTDPDGDALEVTATPVDPSVATVEVDAGTNTLSILPQHAGSTQVTVTARDASTQASQTFTFSVGEVSKSTQIAFDGTADEVIRISNTSDQEVPFRLVHNGFPTFRSVEEVLDFVDAQPDIEPHEPFPKKLWRFVRDTIYHSFPLTPENWLYDPKVMISSLGFGFCGHTAGTFVVLARARGYEARIWGLSGHVVPEIKVDDHWELYDSDLSAYYFNRSGAIASAADLAQDPSLITQPVNPVLPPPLAQYPYTYSDYIAEIYSSRADNYEDPGIFWSAQPAEYGDIRLPAGSELVYPGRWSNEIIGYDGDTPARIPYFLQAMIRLPGTLRGTIHLPWMLWEVRGTGQVRVGGVLYDIGSEGLTNAIQKSTHLIQDLEIVSASSRRVELVFFINPRRYQTAGMNTVSVSSQDAWALAIDKSTRMHGSETVASMPTTLFKPASAEELK